MRYLDMERKIIYWVQLFGFLCWFRVQINRNFFWIDIFGFNVIREVITYSEKICYSVHIQNYTFLLATLSVCSCILNAGPFNSQISIVFCFRKFPQSRFILNSQLIFFPFCYYPCLSLPINNSQTVSGIFVPSSARKRNWSIILNASIKRMCEK